MLCVPLLNMKRRGKNMQIHIWPLKTYHTWMDEWMNGWMDGWICFKKFLMRFLYSSPGKIHHGRGPRSDRCFNGAPCFFNWPCWSLSTCCFKKSTVWRPFVASRKKKKTLPLFVFFCKREIRCLFWGGRKVGDIMQRKASEVKWACGVLSKISCLSLFQWGFWKLSSTTVSMIWVNHTLVKRKVQFQKM